MAHTLPSPCTQPGCPNLVKGGGRCPEHNPRHRNKETDRMYGTPRWQRLRRFVLANEPCCRQCDREGIATVATQVDHIVPVTDGGQAWDNANLQPLCHAHHTAKTNRERVSAKAG